MVNEYKYYNCNIYKESADLEHFGLALDYARNAITNKCSDCSDAQQMDLVDKLVDTLSNFDIKLFKKGITKAELRNVLLYEIFHNKGDFGTSDNTRQNLNPDMLANKALVVDGYSDGYLSSVRVKKDAIFLINRMKGFGTKEAFDRFVGIEQDQNKSIEELAYDALDNNPKFAEVINKVIKHDIARNDFQIMIEMYIKRNIVLNTNIEGVSKMLAKGFSITNSKLVYVISNVLTNEDVEILGDINSRLLFNIGIPKKIQKERNKIKKREEYQTRIAEQKQKEAEDKQRKAEAGVLLTSDQHCAAINEQIRNLIRLVGDRDKNFSRIGTKDGCYLFEVVDFLMANRYSFETLKKIVREKIQYFKGRESFKFYTYKLEQVLKFLTLAERYSTNQPLEASYAYMIDGNMRVATEDEINIAENYLKEKGTVVNSCTLSTVLRRLIIGGDMESKFSKTCLNVKENIKQSDDIPLK